MNPNRQTPSDTLVLRRTYPVPVAVVYKAWTDPVEVKKWWSHTEWDAYVVEIDLKVGGQFKWGLDNRESGKRFTAVGAYKVIEPGKKVIMTWRWLEETDRDVETELMVEFNESDGGTELVLTHSKHPDQALLEDHRGGWTACMDRIAEILAVKSA